MLIRSLFVGLWILLSHRAAADEVAAAGADLCQCLSVQPQQQLCSNMGFTLKGSCCLNKTAHIIGVLLHNCSVEQLRRSSRLGASTFDASAADLIFIDLSMNKLGDVNAEFFRGMTSLASVTVPKSVFEQCPGGKDAWKDQHAVGSDSLQCNEQVDICEETTFNCTAKAECVDCHCANDGPGLVRCPCNDGYYGFKCLKQGTFPFLAFYGILVAATVILCAVLWFTQRRHVRPKHHVQ